ncbi:hypothetical protein C8P68_104452 [Mucilaginibacter yixingensis]|uniref:Uncharacterized protein n=1 Tax=Mucilaginibacter yixingensis TaxID=1295612 RepID=A0A2T5JA75_9SPHI|nr:hypothetical protein C8P68_104452 [Mucilaginibacter yixingensis]
MIVLTVIYLCKKYNVLAWFKRTRMVGATG